MGEILSEEVSGNTVTSTTITSMNFVTYSKYLSLLEAGTLDETGIYFITEKDLEEQT